LETVKLVLVFYCMAFIPVVLGTGRKGNYSLSVAEFVKNTVQEMGHETDLVDPKDHVVSPFTERVGKEADRESAWQAIAKRADAFVFVTPEYNRGIPGELKLLVDQLYGEYAGKFAAICGVSSGDMGGDRAVEALRLVLLGVEMFPIKKAVYFKNIENAKLEDHKGHVEDTINALVKYTKT